MKFRRILIVLAAMSPCASAVDLEDSPDRDIGQVDQAVEEQSETKIETISLPLVKGEPRLDGVLDEPFWKQATDLGINIELYPERFATPIVDTDVKIAMGASHLYVAFRAHDPDIGQRRSVRRTRDGVKDDDYVSVVIDPTGNLRRKFEFRVNPNGSITDVLQDTVSNRYIYDWDTRWRSGAKIDPGGYTVEMEIPLDSVKSPVAARGEHSKWLVFFKRTYPRAVDRTFGGIYIIEREDNLFPIAAHRKIEFIPYYIFHPDEERNPDEPFAQVKDHENHDVGADLRLVFSSASSLSATINPNYTEVEADIARDSINNPFTPFQPEKRTFFQEGRDLYSSFMPVVYTRNIIQPKVGLSYAHTGRETSSGAMWVSDEFTELIMPDNLGSEKVETEMSSRSMAIRMTGGEKGNAFGGLATARLGEGYSNYVAGVDGLKNLGLDDKIRYQLMFSRTAYPESFAEDLCDGDDCLDTAPDSGDCELGDCDTNPYVLRADPTRVLTGHGLRLGYKHDSPESLYWVNYFDYADDYRADLGFDKRTDYRLLNMAYGKNWFIETLKRDKGKSRVRGYLVGNFLQSSEGEQIENAVELWGEFRGSFQTTLRAGWRVKERAVNRIQQDSLALGDNAPLFDESYLQWYYETAPLSTFTFNLDGRYGDIADAENLVLGRMIEFKPKIRVFRGKFNLELAHTYRDFRVDQSSLYRENFSTVQGVYQPWQNHFFRLLYLYDTTDRDTARFLNPELPFEREDTFEFTYLHRREKGISVLAGAKLTQESNSIVSRFTSSREVYIKLIYDLRKDFPYDLGID